MQLTAYRCLECGNYTITKYDGRKCAECGGTLEPMGNANCIDKSKYLSVSVSIKKMDIFKHLVSLLSMILKRDGIPDDIKKDILDYISKLTDKGHIREIKCQNCGAILMSSINGIDKIHLSKDRISFLGDLVSMRCRCGCTVEYKLNK